jgi:CDP-diacylglycerol--glycerol-3-phosphate 3-phosphatidyltransferase
MANIITGVRILCSMALLFVPPFSKFFYVLYLTAGVSDMIDGTVARKTGTANDFGSKFDSTADFIFVAVCLIKLIPLLTNEKWLLIWIVLITVIKVVNILFIIKKFKRIVFLHTILNKITGLLTFILPLTFSFLDFRYTSIVVCIIATIAAIQEGYFLRTKNQDNKIF